MIPEPDPEVQVLLDVDAAAEGDYLLYLVRADNGGWAWSHIPSLGERDLGISWEACVEGLDDLNLSVIDSGPGANVIEHPIHYTSHPSGIECIQITEHMSFLLGNVYKYVWRADLKHDDGGLEDLKKARFYLNREIAKRESQDG
jgi:hypothetical protein